jgi:hypothetical protein
MIKERRASNKIWFSENIERIKSDCDLEVLGADGIHFRFHFSEGCSFDYWPSTLRHKDNQSGKSGNLTQPDEIFSLIHMLRGKEYGAIGESPVCSKQNPTGLPKRLKVNGRVYWAEDWLIDQGKLSKPKGHQGPPVLHEEIDLIDDGDVA